MVIDPELAAIQGEAVDFAVVVLNRDQPDMDILGREYQTSVLLVASSIAEASLRTNVVERCRALETVRGVAARAVVQAEIGSRSGRFDAAEFETHRERLITLSASILKHIRRIRGEYSNRRGKNP